MIPLGYFSKQLHIIKSSHICQKTAMYFNKISMFNKEGHTFISYLEHLLPSKQVYMYVFLFSV